MRRLLYEIVYNLCDNAIKYNVDRRPRGLVGIVYAAVTAAAHGAGYGHRHPRRTQQERVFERFYRVDKSHSKASGGTGLGLSIVKHAVQYHHGVIELKSELGKGTEIRVTFPVKA